MRIPTIVLIFMMSFISACAATTPEKVSPVKVISKNVEQPVKCGLQECHGMDLTCGPSPVEMCTMVYMMGDNCRQFAKCEVRDGQCQIVKEPKFDECAVCVNKCVKDFKANPISISECESKCWQ